MKKNNYLAFIFIALCCAFGVTAFAQTADVATFNEFDTAFQNMKSTGGTINLTANVTISIAPNGSYILASTSGNSITINTGEFKLLAACSTNSGTAAAQNAVLTLGDNVTITGTGERTFEATNRATFKMQGGKVELIRNGTGNTRAILLNANTAMEMSGGEVVMETLGSATGEHVILSADNASVTLKVTGGTLTGIVDSNNNRQIRGIRSSATAQIELSGVTISINSTSANAYGVHPSGKAEIGSGVSITAPTGLYADGSSACIIMNNAANFTFSGTTKYSSALSSGLPNGAIFDLSNLPTIVPTPVNNTVFPGSTGEVTLTLSGGNPDLLSYAGIYYTTTGTAPTGISTEYIASGAPFTIVAATEIQARVGKNGYLATSPQTFNYSVSSVDPTQLIRTITTFAELKDAYALSQADPVLASTFNIAGNIEIRENFEMTPTRPIQINFPSGAYFSVGHSAATTVVFGGDLTMTGTATVTGAIIRIANSGLTSFTINGGTYEMLAAQTLITQASSSTFTINNGTFSALTASGNSRAIQVGNSANPTLIINGGTITVGAGGRGIHMNGASNVQINGGTITMNGSSTASQILRVEVGNNNRGYVEINDGELNTGGGNLIGFNGAGSATTAVDCIVRGGTITSTGTLYGAKSVTTEGAYQAIYDFRAYSITADPATGENLSGTPVTLTLNTTAIDPVDATDASIVYTTNGTEPVAASMAYTGVITVTSPAIIKATAVKGSFTGKTAVFNYGAMLTGLDTERAVIAPYISDNVLRMAETTNVSVFNVNGQLLLKAANVNTLDVSSLSAGLYVVKITEGTFKVIK